MVKSDALLRMEQLRKEAERGTRIEAWGYVSYRVFNPASGHVYKLSEEQLKEDGGTNS